MKLRISPRSSSPDSTLDSSARKLLTKVGVGVILCALLLVTAAVAQGRKLTVLHAFEGVDGGNPLYAGLVRDSEGNLYGTTNSGGDLACSNGSGCGTVFKVAANGEETVLYSFKGGADGSAPGARLWRDAAGNLYGTTQAGGISNAGTIFRLNKAGKETVLYSFTGGTDGGQPLGGLIRDSAGNFYGTTLHGGLDPLQICNSGAGCGVVFKLDLAGNETVLYSFKGETDGGESIAGLVRDSAGNLYGTTQIGGDPDCVGGVGCGTVFKLGKTGILTTLYSFTYGTDGGQPASDLTLDSAGNLYGTAFGGGDLSCTGGNGFGCGVVYKVDTAGQETVLYAFTGGRDGRSPYAGVIRDAAGDLWGTTILGGAFNNGVVYRVNPAGKEIVLHSFTGGVDGAIPYAGVIRDLAGNFYGTTNAGGDLTCGNVNGCGTVFKIAAVAP